MVEESGRPAAVGVAGRGDRHPMGKARKREEREKRDDQEIASCLNFLNRLSPRFINKATTSIQDLPTSYSMRNRNL
jgi:hypothetical protein